jgi:hypothetical protein
VSGPYLLTTCSSWPPTDTAVDTTISRIPTRISTPIIPVASWYGTTNADGLLERLARCCQGHRSVPALAITASLLIHITLRCRRRVLKSEMKSSSISRHRPGLRQPFHIHYHVLPLPTYEGKYRGACLPCLIDSANKTDNNPEELREAEDSDRVKATNTG